MSLMLCRYQKQQDAQQPVAMQILLDMLNDIAGGGRKQGGRFGANRPCLFSSTTPTRTPDTSQCRQPRKSLCMHVVLKLQLDILAATVGQRLVERIVSEGMVFEGYR